MKSPAAGFSFGSDWLAGGGAGSDGCFDACVAALSGGDPGGGGGGGGDMISPACKVMMSSR
jgi:hypothetical protein